MKKKLKMIAVLLGALFLTCSPAYYSPDPHYNPNFSEKGEVNLGANVGFSNNSSNFGFQGAYAISNHIAVKANGNRFISTNDSDDTFSGSGHLIELAPGFFTPIGDKFVFETYGILAKGQVENIRDLNRLNADILRYGIQPSIGMKTKTIELILSTRLASLNHYNIVNNISLLESQELATNNRNVMLEPAFTLKVGSPKIKFVTQLNVSYNLSNSDLRQEEFYLGVGLNANLNILENIRK